MSIKVFPTHLLSEKWDRVYGTEQELYPLPADTLTDQLKGLTFPRGAFFENGGKAYLDCADFYEVCSPETQNPLAAVLYNRAMLHLAKKLNPSREFLRNAADGSGYTSGFHENFFTTLGPDERRHLVPFLISMQPVIGGGLIDSENQTYRIHQRGPHIESLREEIAVIKRGILDSRMEHLSNVCGFYRMHHVLNDPSMCVVGEYLKLATTALVLKGLEQKVIKPLEYNLEKSISDLHQIGTSMSQWELTGVKPKPMNAVNVQQYFLEQIKYNLPNQTELMRFTLDLWEDVLGRLAQNDPDQLIGYNDWATKRWILSDYAAESQSSQYDTQCQAIENAYHTIQFGKDSLFNFIERQYDFPMRIDPRLIYKAAHTAPQNTRAVGRGKVIKAFSASFRYTAEVAWDQISFYVIDGAKKTQLVDMKMSDPRKTYTDEVQNIIDAL